MAEGNTQENTQERQQPVNPFAMTGTGIESAPAGGASGANDNDGNGSQNAAPSGAAAPQGVGAEPEAEPQITPEQPKVAGEKFVEAGTQIIADIAEDGNPTRQEAEIAAKNQWEVIELERINSQLLAVNNELLNTTDEGRREALLQWKDQVAIWVNNHTSFQNYRQNFAAVDDLMEDYREQRDRQEIRSEGNVGNNQQAAEAQALAEAQLAAAKAAEEAEAAKALAEAEAAKKAAEEAAKAAESQDYSLGYAMLGLGAMAIFANLGPEVATAGAGLARNTLDYDPGVTNFDLFSTIVSSKTPGMEREAGMGVFG